MTEKEITLLVEKGIGYIHIEYTGGGDSGAIESITYILNTCEKTQDIWNGGEIPHGIPGTCDNVDKPSKLDEITIEDLAYTHLNHIEDWWNNDGGYGGLIIEIPSLQFKNQNIIEYRESDTYMHDGTLEKTEL
tara:strand:+ start:60 stop:458 length:399 start_codon:yes stop_codon:yes gene_type:complete